MKITSEVPDLSQVRLARQGSEITSGIPKQIQNLDRQYIEAVISRLNMDRALGDALSAAQLSQGLLQKAMEVSSRIQSMMVRTAGAAVNDSGEMKAAAAEIAKLSETGSGVDTFSDEIKSAGGPAVPEVSSALGALGDAVKTSMQSGRIDNEAFNSAASSLAGKNAELKKFTSDVTAGLPVNKSASFTGTETAQISRSIEANPSAALSAQGNLRAELINQLTA